MTKHVGQLRVTKASHSSWSCLDLANATIFIACLTLMSWGYYIGLAKSVFIPTQRILFLGFISNSVEQAFILDKDKRRKFAFLRESLLNSSYISVRSLQKFAGKVVSFSLAVPAVRLFCQQVNTAISKGIKSSRPVKMSPDLKEELMHWRFLDSWDGFLPWKDEQHLVIEIVSDASNFGWGGILHLPDGLKETRDCWSNSDLSIADIAIKEARALHQILSTFAKEVFNSRVNAFVDNSNLISFWSNRGGKSVALSEEIKDLFFLTLKLNINLSMTYVPSKSNLADSPSRFYSDTDCFLSQFAWSLVDSTFGPYTFYLMAIPSNVMKNHYGENLKFFSSHPVPSSSGIDIFTQLMSSNENYYAFPPFVLIGPLLRFFQSQKL